MPINVYYAKLNNMGDLLNEYIIPKVTGEKIVHCANYMKYDVMGIGSFAGAIFSNINNKPRTIIKDIIKSATCRFADKPCAVWGTGFFEDHSERHIKLLRNNVHFIALRGELTKRTIEKSLNREISPVLCDGGILASELLSQKINKKYRVGFIPHYREQELCKRNGLWHFFDDQTRGYVIINLRGDPLSVIRQISECDLIISSSLHGCIVADSFHIPNMRVSISDIPGTGYKFDDYYSAFGLSIPAVNIQTTKEIPTENQIIDNYKLSFKAIDQKKIDMANCLVEYLRSVHKND